MEALVIKMVIVIVLTVVGNGLGIDFTDQIIELVTTVE